MIKINLLPKREIKRAASPIGEGVSKDILLKLALPVGVVVLLVLAVFAYMEITKSSLKKEIEDQKKILAQLQQKIEEVKKFEALNKDIETKTKLIEELKKKQSVPVTILSSIAKTLPEGVWLTEVNYGMPVKKEGGQTADKEKEKMAEKTIVTKGFGFSNLNIVAFVEALKKSPDFSDINLVETQQTIYDNVPVYKFILEFKLKE
ncbi:MAG: PilN domain-containing protein [Thermodesulfovibrio sp.]|uniref:PilN domain-containing protein n=1 Tax=Thermodesulfovibrio sp. N1 TaxID=1871110 RepID=UPI00083ADA7D|nr:PilN domain-containing protein [Thermodesulfovibrio sp. N1]MDI6713972.1 PilN domain-containing protein [Thermodesulfovibrio sp.]ODA44982.1 Type IV pilus biogenesis protein PilN [Thermodesulfovibrio sp. N1]